MRRYLLLIAVVLIVATSATGVSASTDCERWFAAYKAELAHSHALERAKAARARMRHYAKKKLANYVKKPDGPKLIRVHVRHHYTPEEIRNRFKLLCGDLPDDKVPVEKLLSGRMTPGDFASEQEPAGPVDLASNDGPPPIGPTGSGPTSGGTTPDTPGGPPLGAGPIFGGGGGGGGTTPGSPGNPGTPDVPPVTPVPEPGSIVLLLTGAVGAAGEIRRRMKR
jgi:hypothetical protein